MLIALICNYFHMKPSKQLSVIALLSLLALTACTNNDDTAKTETPSVASGAQDTTPSADETMTGAENSGAIISASSDKDDMTKEESETNEKDSDKTPASEKQKFTKKQDANKEEDSDDKDSDGDEDNDEDDDRPGSAPSPATITNTVTAPAKNTPTSAVNISSPSTKSGQANYKTPAGSDSMKVSITTKNGIITETSATPMATNPVSLRFQQSFAGKISGNVVGKSIKGLKVDTVSGASLTTAAFNDFLASN